MSIDVSIVMGSDSDLHIMIKACEVFDELGITYDTNIISAHRTPDELFAFMKNSTQDGRKVFIAGAGGAAHLGGVMAALTPAPVIGVPITSTLNGQDSLLSTVQMPSGIPVATMAINGSKNAAIMAAKILAVGDADLKERLISYTQKMAEEVTEKGNKIRDIGPEAYLKAYEQNK